MRPRLVLDIGWRDLAAGLGYALAARRRERRAASLEERWRSPEGIAAFSVRSALDLYLAARAFPPKSEVLVSALTIRDMPRVIEAHGLVPVPVDLDPATLAPSQEALERAFTARTRAVLVAHLFGSRVAVAPVVEFARARGIEVWEDCAQAYTGDAWRGERKSDLVLFSFGTIKTATALGGALARVRDPEALARMRAIHATWPVQTRAAFAKKVAKTILLKGLGTRALFTPFAGALALLGRDRDALLHAAVRAFPGPDLMRTIRRQPSAPLLALLERRLASDTCSRVGRRRSAGAALEARLPDGLALAGARSDEKSYWVFPLRTRDPARLVARLRRAGFDATTRSSLYAVESPPHRAPARAAKELLEHLVFVPLVASETRAFERLVRALADDVVLADLELVAAEPRKKASSIAAVLTLRSWRE